MHDQRPDHATRPGAGLSWRDPVLWILIGPPLGAVIGGLFTVWIAATNLDPLVSDTVRKVGVTWKDAAPPAAAPAATPATTPGDGPAPDDRGG